MPVVIGAALKGKLPLKGPCTLSADLRSSGGAGRNLEHTLKCLIWAGLSKTTETRGGMHNSWPPHNATGTGTWPIKNEHGKAIRSTVRIAELRLSVNTRGDCIWWRGRC